MARIEKNIYEQLLKALQDARKVNVITSYYGEKGRIGNELKKELTGNKDILKISRKYVIKETKRSFMNR